MEPSGKIDVRKVLIDFSCVATGELFYFNKTRWILEQKYEDVNAE